MLYGAYISPFAGYKPKPLKWYQKVWYSFHVAKRYGKHIPVAVISGLITGLMIGISNIYHYHTYHRK